MKKRVIMLSSGNTLPLEKEDYDRANLAVLRNIGRNLRLEDGSIIRTNNIEYVGILDDDEEGPANAIEQIDALNTEVKGLKEDNAEHVTTYKTQAEKALKMELTIKNQTAELKKLKESNEELLDKLGIAEANLKAEKVKKTTAKTTAKK